MTAHMPKFIVSSRAESVKLGFAPATVLLRLPLGWHSLNTRDKQAIAERELARAVPIMADKIAAEVG